MKRPRGARGGGGGVHKRRTRTFGRVEHRGRGSSAARGTRYPSCGKWQLVAARLGNAPWYICLYRLRPPNG
jgi:hypothetical protein